MSELLKRAHVTPFYVRTVKGSTRDSLPLCQNCKSAPRAPLNVRTVKRAPGDLFMPEL